MYIDVNSLDSNKLLKSSSNGLNIYLETYGCQMNLNDSEIVAGILTGAGYGTVEDIENADVILLNTCSVRDNAEVKIHRRLNHLKNFKKKNSKLVIGILGCMAERLKEKLIGRQDLVSIVVGPDEYRNLPDLLTQAFRGENGIAVKLSKVETYDDIIPLRTDGISAWISISRGCDKFCTFCVVPFTRGRERSKPARSIIEEAISLWNNGIKEITLLGQNVNSYNDWESKTDFPKLLENVALSVPKMRIRYTTSHPYDMSNELIDIMGAYDNICEYIHLPVQSGSNQVLEKMNRHYTVEQYLEKIDRIKDKMPRCSLSTDIISGFPGETEEDHQLTLELMKKARYDGAYMFMYSPRENTRAWKMEDDIPIEVKKRRLSEIIDLQNIIASENNKLEIGEIHDVLVEGVSKKKKSEWQGRTSTNKVVIYNHAEEQVGDTIRVKINRSTSATLFGQTI